MKQLSLFDTSDLIIGSDEWRRIKYDELCCKTFDELCVIESEIYGNYEILNKWSSSLDYHTLCVIIDVFHYYYFDKFIRRYPKALVYKVKPKYLI